MSIEYTDESALIAIDEHMRSPKGHWLLAFRFNDNSFLLDRQTSPDGFSRTALFNVELEETAWVSGVVVRKTAEYGNMLCFQTDRIELKKQTDDHFVSCEYEIAIPIGDLDYDFADLEDVSKSDIIVLEPSEFENIMSIYDLDDDGNETPVESIPCLTQDDDGDFSYDFGEGYVLHIYGCQKAASLDIPDWYDTVDVASITDFGLPMGGVGFDLGGFYLFLRSYTEVA